jgi:F-box and leucine-rich repeat protein GRR1
VLKQLKDCRRLERVNLAGCQALTQATILAVVPQWSSLITLDVTDCRESVTDVVVSTVAKKCRNLQNIYLGLCQQLTDESIINLANSCAKLRRVSNDLIY